ncbi:ATP-binding protein [Dermacoccaceae bacterium W4C1]
MNVPEADLIELRRWADELPDGIVVADGRGRLVLAGSRAESITGLDLGSHLGEQLTEVLPLHDRDHRDWWACHDPWAGLSTRSRLPEHLVHVPEGASALLTAAIARDEQRQVQRVILVLRDTRARNASDADALGLLTTVAHELRSPLSSVRSFARTLRGRWEQLQDAQKLWMLEAIENDAGRLSRLVGELLDVSRIDTGRLVLHRAPVDVAELVHEQLLRFVAAGQERSRFTLELRTDDTVVAADADRITQVVGNLLENALRHGAGQVTVVISEVVGESGAPGQQPALELTVADEGPGVEAALRERIFERYWQASTGTGTGLGLYVVRALVEAHGGSVRVDDSPSGARFTLRLPR